MNELKALKDSHDQYMEEYALGEVHASKKRDDLRNIIVTKVVKPSRGAGYGPLLPKSFELSLSSSVSSIH